jgi:hypothetical protein
LNERVQLNQVYFETRRYGDYLRVACIDPKTGQESYSTGPVKMGVEVLKRAAKRKLEYILTKKLKES